MNDFRTNEAWPDVTSDDWESWQWQLEHGLRSMSELAQVIELSEEERAGGEAAAKVFKMRISPFIAERMGTSDPEGVLRRQFVPSRLETESLSSEALYEDVNADSEFSHPGGLVHRYPSKVLVFPSNYCGAYCRYCFRRKLVGEIEEALGKEVLSEAFSYIRCRSEIEEVIFSGGDPLVLSDDDLHFCLDSLARIDHVQIVRFHTRMPITIPYRITENFVGMLKEFKGRFPVYFVLHADTADEVKGATSDAIRMLVDNGFPCLCSCPLLRGINDNAEALRRLWTELVKLRVKPYYLFHSDPVQGLRHFLVPLSHGIDIMQRLYDRMSGLSMPLYCFNAPGGGGHVLLGYNYVCEERPGFYSITTFEGKTIHYDENAALGGKRGSS